MQKKAHRKPAKKSSPRKSKAKSKLVRLTRAIKRVKGVLLDNGQAAPPVVQLQRANFDAVVWFARDRDYTIHWKQNDPFGMGDIAVPQGEAVIAWANPLTATGHYAYTLAAYQIQARAAAAPGDSSEMFFGNPEVIIQ